MLQLDRPLVVARRLEVVDDRLSTLAVALDLLLAHLLVHLLVAVDLRREQADDRRFPLTSRVSLRSRRRIPRTDMALLR
jgi:hypothetical protein